MNPDIERIAQHFNIEGIFSSANPHGAGHINDTYLVAFATNGTLHKVILQRINHQVFQNPGGMMSNIELVTTHLSRKIESLGGDPMRETLRLIPTIDGKSYLHTAAGEYWRAYHFIDNARTYDLAADLDQVYNAAIAFGKFQKLLSDFLSAQLVETIPNFHNTRQRFDTFVESLQSDHLNRASSCKPEIDFVLHREADTSLLVDMWQRGELPERVTHNDTKFNNVLIDDTTGAGICVLDLDTVMPGLSLFDFGDGVRYLANSGAEDERDLSLIQFERETYQSFAQGYLNAVGDVLTPSEIEYLPFSAILMTLECGIRFLTDHLQGDRYFKTNRQNQNLDRCRTQFKLVADMESDFDQMVKIIDYYR